MTFYTYKKGSDLVMQVDCLKKNEDKYLIMNEL